MADRPRRVSPLPPPFEQVDQKQLARHATLVELWRHCDLLELLSDLNVLHQVLYFRAHQEAITAQAALDVAKGAGHDCEEWPNREGRCLLCGGSVMFGPGH